MKYIQNTDNIPLIDIKKQCHIVIKTAVIISSIPPIPKKQF